MTAPTPSQANKLLFYVVLGVVTAGLVYLLAPILTPFLVAALLAYLSNPLVTQLMKWHISRLTAVIIVFFILLIGFSFLIFLLVPVIQKQIVALIELAPIALAWAQQKIITLMLYFDVTPPNDLEGFTLNNVQPENILRASGGVKWLLQAMLHSSKVFILDLINTILTIVVTFYLLRDWDLVIHKIYLLIPKKIAPTIAKFTKECDQVLSEFFRGQLLVMVFVAIFYSIAFSILGLKVSVLLGLIIGLVSIVPYLGLVIGILIASAATLFQFGDPSYLMSVLLIFLIGHSIENFYLTPKLIGERIGLHPVAVIFAILAGGELFGFFGILLALPFASVLMVLLRHVHRHYRQSPIYKN